jgi:pSer/pThr/pTyr-binding forkhead associated (FHA) protein
MTMAAPELVLTVRRPPGRAHVYRFSRGPVTVGRNRGCSVHLPDAQVSGVHLRFVLKGDRWLVLDPGSNHGVRVGRAHLSANRPHPVRSADAITLGPYLVEIFLDEGGGLTTDSRDTDRLAKSLEDEARQTLAGGWSVWVIKGGGAGRTVGLQRGKTALVGSGRGCDLPLDGPSVAGRHLSLTLDRDGRLTLAAHAGGVRVRGQSVRRAVLWPNDTIHVGDTVLQVRGPSTVAPPAESGGLSFLEVLAVVVILASVGAMIWAWMGG